MWFLTIALSVLFAVFSTVVMSYLSMAIPIGPWIAPTLALIGMLIFSFIPQKNNKIKKIALATSAGSIGGILANAFGFYFPTLYFLDQSTFNVWLSNPLHFAMFLGVLGIISGWFGLWVANVMEHKFIVQEKLAFPIGQLVHKTIVAQTQVRKAVELAIGFLGTTVFCFFQDGLRGFAGFIPKSFVLISPRLLGVFKIPLVKLDIWPMLWALGFVTGHVIALPLAVGVLAKILLVSPANLLVFSEMKPLEFTLTFSSGMVLFGAVFGFIATPKSLWKAAKNIFQGNFRGSRKDSSAVATQNLVARSVELSILLVPTTIFLSYFGFSFVSQFYLLLFGFVCAYQIAQIAGKIGLAFMGRFATFVMVPAMYLFGLDAVQITIVTTFVGVAGGVATDVLFSRKLAQLAEIKIRRMKVYQYFGLILSCLCLGVVFWFLINHFGLGSQDLFAYRAQNRWLLIRTLQNAGTFNLWVLLLGFLFGFVLKKLKISPMLVLGGLFMPVNISFGLVLGGCLAFLVKEKEQWFPFWSGVYASNSVWMLLRAILQ